ncbi:hypothetical protein N665_0523s0008 [Sinapis alba]|nr:hypothetical protein N665_0523s0008 [Sinapis alba]
MKRQIEVFDPIALQGYIYSDRKPVHWSPSCRAACAEAEFEALQCEQLRLVKVPSVTDNIERINIKGKEKTEIWVPRLELEVSQTWEPRRGKSGVLITKYKEYGSPNKERRSTNENQEGPRKPIEVYCRGLRNIT